MTNNPFDNVLFADHFSNVQGDSTVKTNGPGLKELIETEGIGKDEWIMDLGCGAGPLVKFLYEEGYRVAGLDYSAHMIGKAKARFESGYDQDRLDLFQANVIDWVEEERYALVYSVGEVLSLLFEKADFLKGLSRVYSALKPGGVFVFDFVSMSEKTEPYSYQSSTIYQNQSDIVSMTVNPVLGIQQTHRAMYHREPETGKFIGESSVFTMRMHRPEALVDIVASVGFVDIYFADRVHLITPMPPEEIKTFKFCVCKKPSR